jgi:hypothetical protein
LIGREFPEFRESKMPLENVTPKFGSDVGWQGGIDSRTVALVRDRHDLDLRLYEAAVSLNATRGHPIP